MEPAEYPMHSSGRISPRRGVAWILLYAIELSLHAILKYG